MHRDWRLWKKKPCVFNLRAFNYCEVLCFNLTVFVHFFSPQTVKTAVEATISSDSKGWLFRPSLFQTLHLYYYLAASVPNCLAELLLLWLLFVYLNYIVYSIYYILVFKILLCNVHFLMQWNVFGIIVFMCYPIICADELLFCY